MKLAFSIAGSQIPLPGDVQKLSNNAGAFGVNILKNVLNLLFYSVGILALFFIIYGGIKWITSSGDPKNIEAARNTILYASIGLFIAFLSVFIVNVLGGFFGVNLLGAS